MNKKTIFSGIQPSGNLHLGNYLGAIVNWVAMQEEYENPIFCVVDLHAVTVPQDPKELREKTIEIAKIYMAAGIDPKKSTIFVQSDVPAHAELMWCLNTIAKTGELFKMTQFKDKTGIKEKANVSIDVGLLNYPILMAADILLYDTDVVPVGEDQKQHVELARILARRFNDRFGETFKVPEAVLKKETMRIMSLDNPEKKMSKSAKSKYDGIGLLDAPDTIREKIKKAVTDSGSEVKYSDKKPAIQNLLNIFSAVTAQQPDKIAANYAGKGYAELKKDLAEAVVEFLALFQKKFHETPDSDVKIALKQGKEKLLPVAEKKMKEVKEKMGLGI